MVRLLRHWKSCAGNCKPRYVAQPARHYRWIAKPFHGDFTLCSIMFLAELEDEKRPLTVVPTPKHYLDTIWLLINPRPDGLAG
ncbi:MAG: hypothetical protein ACI9B8_002088 [Sulfitobacter sp.]|jgi:hypothetical protein